MRTRAEIAERRRVACATIALLVGAFCLADERPLTRAEDSNFAATSLSADVRDFIHALQQRSDLLRLETLGISAAGQPIPLLVIGDPVPSSPGELRHDDRLVAYFQANIHGGEVEGKEAALMLARTLVLDSAPDVLDRLVVLIAPVFNVDGNDRISRENRPRQNGPAEGVGHRLNGRNQDLNRDGTKLESPEVGALVSNVLNRWDPVFFFDAHTHNGSYHQAPVTWVWGLNPLGDQAIFDYLQDVAWPAIERRMSARFDTPTIPHGDFLDPREPERGWVPVGPEPRYLTNYVGLRNRLAVLNEQYPYADFRTRVMGSYHLMLAFLELLHEDRDRIVGLVTAADRRTIARGLDPSPDDVFIVGHGREPLRRRLTIRGYEMEVEGDGPYPRVRPTDTERTYRDVPYLARYTAGETVRLPRGYLIAVEDPRIVDKLRQHGVRVERLVERVRVPVEVFTVEDLTGADRSIQGHYPSSARGAATIEEREFEVGTYYVTTAQPLANVAAYLLEPRSDDGLVYWNYFDLYLAFQWRPEPKEYPVYKLHESLRLVTETVGG